MSQELANKLGDNLIPASNSNNPSLVSTLQSELLASGVFTKQKDIDGYLGYPTLKALLDYASKHGIPVSSLKSLDQSTLKKIYHKMFDEVKKSNAELTDGTIEEIINDTYSGTSEYSYIIKYDYETVNDSFVSKVNKYKFPDEKIPNGAVQTPYSFSFYGGWHTTYNTKTKQEYDYYKKYKFGNGNLGENEYWSHGSQFSGLSYNNINEALIDKTDFKSYIINLATNTWVPLPVLPESVSEAVSAQWTDTSIIGRSASYRSYQGTSNRTVNFNLKLHMDLLSDLSNSNLDLTAITDYLKALTYPEYSKSELRPPVVILKLADVIKLRGTCDSVNVTYELPLKTMMKYRHTGKLMYSQCTVSFQFTEVPVIAPTSSDIARGKKDLFIL